MEQKFTKEQLLKMLKDIEKEEEKTDKDFDYLVGGINSLAKLLGIEERLTNNVSQDAKEKVKDVAKHLIKTFIISTDNFALLEQVLNED